MGKQVVLLFAGQGAQKVGMGKDLGAERFSKVDDRLGFSLSEIMFEGPMEELTRTSRCQPALYAHGLICLDMLHERVPGLDVAGAAGLSLGEFTAHAAVGTFEASVGLDLVAKRGQFMEEATNATEGSMAAMIGGDEDAVKALAKACDVDVANYNAPGQIVLSGSKAGIAKALAECKEHGIKMGKELPVAGAYHSRLMASAQEKLAVELAAAKAAGNIESPRTPVICNVEAREVVSPDEITNTLEAQVTGSVRWTESMQAFLGRGLDTFIEIGPGGVLAGLMKRISREATVISIEDAASLDAAVERLKS